MLSLPAALYLLSLGFLRVEYLDRNNKVIISEKTNLRIKHVREFSRLCGQSKLSSIACSCDVCDVRVYFIVYFCIQTHLFIGCGEVKHREIICDVPNPHCRRVVTAPQAFF